MVNARLSQKILQFFIVFFRNCRSLHFKENENIPHYGGVGVGLLNVAIFQRKLDGQPGCVNKGVDPGATFWFEASLKKCQEVFEDPSYKKHLNKRNDDCSMS